MKKLAIIAEFNPFHEGHKYLIEKARDLTRPDIALAIMSGDFVQRGEAAILDKFTRASIALNNGLDLVIEMPSFISLQSAKFFASKSIDILNKLGIDYLAFGIENMESDDFKKKIDSILEKNDLIEKKTRDYLDKNYSYTKASYLALEDIAGIEFLSSNNILALEYINAIKNINPKIEYLPIPRRGALNREKNISHPNFASSSAIRANLDKDLSSLMPEDSYEELKKAMAANILPSADSLFRIFQYKLVISNNNFDKVLAYEEGMEEYFKKILVVNPSLDDFINKAISPRYPASRIKRLIINYLLDNTSTLNDVDINFIKILALNKKAKAALGDMGKDIKIIMRKAESLDLDNDNLLVYKKMIEASNLYSIISNRSLNRDYKVKF